MTPTQSSPPAVLHRLEDLVLRGRRAYFYAFVAGILWSLSFAPFFFLPAAYISFALPCLWVAYDLPRRQGMRRALMLMATWSFTLYLSSLYWVSHAVWLSFGQSLFGAVAGASAVLGLCLYLSLFALAALFATLLLPRGSSASPLLRVGLFVCTFTLAEELRGVLLGGFPWNFAGYAWNTSLWLLQTNALGGIELTSFLALASYALAALSLFHFAHGARRDATRALLCALAIPACAAGFGVWRLADAPQLDEKPPLIRIVQPNILQQKKWRVEDAFVNFQRALDLSVRDRPSSVALVLWPETAFPYRLTTEETATGQVLEHPWMSALVAIVPKFLIFGAVRENKRNAESGNRSGYRNSVLMIDALGGWQGGYDKVRLVPIGEFIPFANNRFVRGIKTLTNFPSFVSGEASPLLHAASLFTLEVQICYESIFPNLLPFVAFSHDDGSPDFLFNATNDGWFGRSSGPYQHLAMARVRALERGLPFFRAANTGISTVFDPFGRELARRNLNTEGWIDTHVPSKTDRFLLTAQLGNGLFWLVWFGATAACLTFGRRKGMRDRPNYADF